ncbi:MAG TPA: aspartate 1-decarboxylase [Pseudonocardia sp.]|jgi:aspartate 1-decarboxylase|uniref:aspartate 1-decarboxylase n=1 Tax=Pseudonocardia sp. TaxID=60912 RepID=UPI002B4B17A6|nr:aspartate 1-decarboxylase [Pseudonocardia sp.]HLU55685.1 aspartate 1-decarboxylase [Pseudonocardia sp.]
MSTHRAERYRTLLSGKIHRATVTQADLDYVGSLTIDQDLMDAAGLVEGEQVQVVDVTNGARLTTYAIAGERGSGVIGVNGAAAHLVHPGDLTIIMAFQQVPESAVAEHVPAVVHVDAHNRIVALGADPAQPVPGAAEQLSGR